MNNRNQPNIVVQTFLSLCKWFFIVLIVNNLIWAAVHFGYFSQSFGGTHVEMKQDETDNNQSINNG